MTKGVFAMTQRRVLSMSVAFVVTGLLAPGLFGTSRWATAQQPQLVSGGQAFGTFVSLEGVVQSQKSSVVGMGCSVDPLFKQRAAPSVDLAPIGTVGQIQTTAHRTNNGSMIRGKTIAEIENINLLEGIITADALKAVAITKHTDTGFGAHASGTQFLGLNVAGLPIDINPPVNLTIPLLGFGEVVLNERQRVIKPNRARQQTTMLRVAISLPNVLGIPVGTEVIVGSATSQMKSVFARLGGGAHGGSVTVVDNTLLSPLFGQGMWCGGTDGAWQTNSGVAVGLPGVLGVGAIENRIRGTATPDSANATAVSTIGDVNLLAGLVSAEAIKGRVHMERTPDSMLRRFAQSGFVGLQVAGFPEIADDVGFNTNLDILGLGELWLKRVTYRQNGAKIRMIQILVLENNGLGLPVGAEVLIGKASLNAKPF